MMDDETLRDAEAKIKAWAAYWRYKPLMPQTAVVGAGGERMDETESLLAAIRDHPAVCSVVVESKHVRCSMKPPTNPDVEWTVFYELHYPEGDVDNEYESGATIRDAARKVRDRLVNW